MANWLDKWVNRGLCWLLGHEAGSRYVIRYARPETCFVPPAEGLPANTQCLSVYTHGTLPYCPRCRRDL